MLETNGLESVGSDGRDTSSLAYAYDLVVKKQPGRPIQHSRELPQKNHRPCNNTRALSIFFVFGYEEASVAPTIE
jgi:hypothetical protein